jgi:hypothetical protein
MFSVLWPDPRLYNEKLTITDSSFGSQTISRGLSSRKKMTVCQIVIYERCNKLYKGPIDSIIKYKTPVT